MRCGGQDLVFHFLSTTTPASAEGDPTLDVRTNIAQSVDLLTLAVEAGIRHFYFASTGGAIYGPQGRESYSEETPALPVSPYAIGKLAIEHYLRYFRHKHGLESTALRISNPYGPGQLTRRGQGLIPIALDRVLHGDEVVQFGDGSMVRDYLYVEDLVAMILRIVEVPAREHDVYNLGSGVGQSVSETLATLRQVTGVDFPIRILPRACDLRRPGCARHRALSERVRRVRAPSLRRRGFAGRTRRFAMATEQHSVLATVAILTYNGETYLEQILDALERQVVDGEFEVLVIDSGSIDRTLDIVRARPHVRLHEIPNTEFGHGKTRNLAAQLANGEFVAYLTHDAVPASDSWLHELLAPFRMSDEVVAVLGKQIPRPLCQPIMKYDIVHAFARFGPDYGTSLFYRDAFADFEPVLAAMSFYSDVNSAARRSLLLDRIPYREVRYAEDQMFGRDVIDAGLVKAYAPRAAVVHSNDLTFEEFGHRIFDETVALRQIGADVPRLSRVTLLKYMIKGGRLPTSRVSSVTPSSAGSGSSSGSRPTRSTTCGSGVHMIERLASISPTTDRSGPDRSSTVARPPRATPSDSSIGS